MAALTSQLVCGAQVPHLDLLSPRVAVNATAATPTYPTLSKRLYGLASVGDGLGDKGFPTGD